MRERSHWLGLVLVAAIGAAAWLLWPRAPTPLAPSARLAPAAPASLEPAPEDPATPPDRAPPPVPGGAPAACPEDDVDPPGFVRPSVWELLRTRTQELRDRLPQLARDASPELRDGLNGLGAEDPLAAVSLLRAAPDRDRDGFDVAIAAMLHLGMRALARGDAAEALAWAERAAREDPRDPLAHALAAIALEPLGHPSDASSELRLAHGLAPDEPAIALASARALADGGEFDGALRAVDVYLAAVPEDARITSWRARIAARAELTRTHARRASRGLVVAWPARSLDVRAIDALEAELARAIDEVAARTETVPRPLLVAVVYDTLDELRRATCAPSWSGGIFDGVLHLDAATVRGPHLARVARHEATHAQLRTLRAPIPSWLDEGFAQEMEGAPSPAARAAWRRLVERRYWIPFASLEGELVGIEDPEPAALAYHQSLAMFLFLRERGGEGAVRAAFERVREGHREDLLAALVPGADGEALLAFLAERLDTPPTAATPAR